MTINTHSFKQFQETFFPPSEITKIIPKNNILETKRIVEGSMIDGYGLINAKNITALMDKLNKNAAEGIKFDPNNLDPYLSGGVCSAHSLNFIKSYLSSNITNLHKRVTKVAEKYTKSSQELRTHQAALNTISKAQEEPPLDFMKAKIESLAKLHDLEVEYATRNDLYIKDGYNNAVIDANHSCFYDVIENLPEGIFLIRAIRKEDNIKGEYYGHSMAYINQSDGHYFFDPSHGCYQIANKEVKKKLFDFVANQCSTWGLNYPRFYKLKLKDGL